ncbi:response regulator [Corallococcus praedator]|uniref:Response regulator n=2 Tax=Myxococcaceae TaxID=31 RepID=A0ABX9QDM3_9BACT|nr:response regulator [Corallococcus sp. CA047B]RKH28694.1 response regulator [Corallococcus sp. CA031C]RKI02290.1 response regulator [Corallococcus praedator]
MLLRLWMMNDPPMSEETPRAVRILVAEDDDAMRALLVRTLMRAGYVVVEVEDGFELGDYLAMMRGQGGTLEPLDLIISDVRMPGRTGLEALKQLREQGVSCPVLLLSAFADAETHEEARRLGARQLLDKPVDLDVLKAAVREAVQH